MTETLILGAVAYDPKVVTIWDGFREWFRSRGLDFDYVLYSNYERQVDDLVGYAERARRELPEFQRPVLDSLRQPLETGECVVARANGRVAYPARFQLAWSLQSDERVQVFDRTNVRELTTDTLGGPVDVVVSGAHFRSALSLRSTWFVVS